MDRGTVLAGGAAALVIAGALLITNASPAAGAPVVTVYKSSTCGCCAKWARYMRRQGFNVETHDTDAMATVKNERGIPRRLHSCHTADVEGYVIEGHVPSDVIEQLLAERPPIDGLAAPGMPGGSPGMEDAPRERYDVVAYTRSGTTTVYASRGW